MGRKTYSAEKIGQVRARLVSNAGYIKPTAEQEGVAKETVTRWRDGDIPAYVKPEDVEKAQEEATRELASVWSKVGRLGAEVALEQLGSGKVGAKDAAIVGAIGTDKAQLLLGKPTERTELVDFVSWLRQPPAERTKSGTNQAPEPGVSVLPVVKQN